MPPLPSLSSLRSLRSLPARRRPLGARAALRAVSLAACLLAPALLAACDGGVRDTARSLGIGVRQSPDQFAVVQNDPLALPEDLATLGIAALPAPRNETLNAAPASAAEREAKSLLVGRGATVKVSTDPGRFSSGERSFLRLVGANGSERGIRALILADEDIGKRRYLGDVLLFWQNRYRNAALVDAPAETERLERLRETGEAATGEGVPVVGDRRR